MTDALTRAGDQDSARKLPLPGTFDYMLFIRERFYAALSKQSGALCDGPFRRWQDFVVSQIEWLERAQAALREEFERERGRAPRPSGQTWLDEIALSVYRYRPGTPGFQCEVEAEFYRATELQWLACAANGDAFLLRIARKDLEWRKKVYDTAPPDFLEPDPSYRYAETGIDRALHDLGKRIEEAKDFLKFCDDNGIDPNNLRKKGDTT